MKKMTKGAGWKTVSRRKTKKPRQFRAGLEELVKPEVVAPPACHGGARICPLKAIEPQETKGVLDNDGWMSVDMAVDSAATETVLG